MIDVVFTDTHFGWKNNSMNWLNSQINFIYKQFIPKIKQLSKKDNVRVIHLGDVFDSRSTISTYVASKVIQAFKDIREQCNEFIIVCGNHDFYSPNSDIVNTVKLLMSNLNIDIVDQHILERDNHAYIPWYVWEKGDFEIDSKYVFCHADIIGDILPYQCDGKTIFAGHIHIPNINTKKGIYNLGSCYSLDFADSNSTRGFYIIIDNKISFEPNKHSINFYRLYNDEILNADISKFNTNDYIELYINEHNISREDYVNSIKIFTDNITHLWIIPQINIKTNTNESFESYDIEHIITNTIPDELTDYFAKVKNKLKKQIE